MLAFKDGWFVCLALSCLLLLQGMRMRVIGGQSRLCNLTDPCPVPEASRLSVDGVFSVRAVKV